MNKKGAYTDLFILIIFTFVIVVFSAVFIYIGGLVETETESALAGRMFGNENATDIINETIAKTNSAYLSLYWIALFLIVGMIISIFIGSYMVTTRPVFFIPYIFVVIIAIVFSVGISNAYEQIAESPELTAIFANFIGANYILAQLPIIISIVGITGGIIMFSRLGSKENQVVGYYG